jgi:hypothetical protein
VVASRIPGTTSTYINQQNGTFSSSSASTVNFNCGFYTFGIADFNADGVLDIVNEGTIYFGDGTGSFPTSASYPAVSTNYLGAADLNGDGKPDFVVQTYENFLTSYINNGCTKY